MDTGLIITVLVVAAVWHFYFTLLVTLVKLVRWAFFQHRKLPHFIQSVTWYRAWVQWQVVDKMVQWIAWRLPRSVVYWAVIRMWAHGTTGKYGNTHPMSLTLDQALERWER